MENNIVTFNTVVSFVGWVKTYNDTIDLQKQVGITTVFRGVRRNDPTKCVAIVWCSPGVLEEYITVNGELISRFFYVHESTVVTT